MQYCTECIIARSVHNVSMRACEWTIARRTAQRRADQVVAVDKVLHGCQYMVQGVGQIDAGVLISSGYACSMGRE